MISNPSETRRRCVICGKLTLKWQRINGGPWHCYDKCKSTVEKISIESNQKYKPKIRVSQNNFVDHERWRGGL